jgi:cell division protein ZapA
MQEDDLKTVKITLAGRIFPVKVTPEEERPVKELETELNQKISDFQNMYPGRDKLDCVIMTLLTYTYDLKKTTPSADLQPVNEKIDAIKAVLDELTTR